MRKTKNHCNQLLYGLICLILIVIGFTSCEAEKNFANENAKINYVKINDVPFLIPVIQQFNHSYDYLSNPSLKDNNSKILNLNLNLDLENIIEYVYANGLKTYSVKINKEFQENEDKYFENLHIYEKNMVYESFVLKYNEIDDNKIFDITNFTGDIEIYDTNYVFQGLIQFERGRREHTKIIHGGWHIWIHNGTVDVWFVNPNSGVSTTDYHPNDEGFLFIAAAPTTILENGGGGNTSLTVPCEMLKALANPQTGDLKNKINILLEKVENDETNTTESVVTIKKTLNQDETYTYTETTTEGVEMSAPFNLDSQSIIVVGHNHPSNGYDIPGWGDVKALRDLYDNAFTRVKDEVTVITVCKDDSSGEKLVYAMVVENYTALNTAVNAIWTGNTYGVIADEKDRMDKILNDQGSEYTKYKNELEKSFLQQFSSYGITLLKATNNDLTDWEKIDLNSDPSLPIGNQLTVQRTPCN